MEIGGPMACMYLLGNPDHYTNHQFTTFYWQSYVNEARRVWHPDVANGNERPERVALIKRHGRIVGMSPVYDYIYRSEELECLSLYQWVRRCKREKLSNPSNSEDISGDSEPDDLE
ncbi:hypothetical protein BD779DRAFT_1410619, partial [Infundibulicybe gibba]